MSQCAMSKEKAKMEGRGYHGIAGGSESVLSCEVVQHELRDALAWLALRRTAES